MDYLEPATYKLALKCQLQRWAIHSHPFLLVHGGVFARELLPYGPPERAENCLQLQPTTKTTTHKSYAGELGQGLHMVHKLEKKMEIVVRRL